jgi:hypothetical protein
MPATQLTRHALADATTHMLERVSECYGVVPHFTFTTTITSTRGFIMMSLHRYVLGSVLQLT